MFSPEYPFLKPAPQHISKFLLPQIMVRRTIWCQWLAVRVLRAVHVPSTHATPPAPKKVKIS